MLTRLSLRLRVFLIFAGLAAAVVAATVVGLWLGYQRLGDPLAAKGFVQAGVLAGFAALGLVAGVWYLFDLNVDRKVLIDASIRAENDVAGASTGGMDQAIAMLAERGHALLLDCLDGSTRQIPLDVAASGARIMVIDTNAPHRLVDGQYGARRAALDRAYLELGVSTLRGLDPERAVSGLVDQALVPRVRHVTSEIRRVERAVALLDGGDIGTELGDLMTASHVSLRDDYEVSSPELDSAVDAALRAGAYGARMTGGGFGGSAIALVPIARVDAVAEEIFTSAQQSGLPEPTFLSAEPSGPAHRFR